MDHILGVIPFSIASALCMGVVWKRTKIPEDTAIGILWAMGMAIGIILIGLTQGYAPDLFGYLFGSILTVPTSGIILMLCLHNTQQTFAYLLSFSPFSLLTPKRFLP